MSKKPDSNSDKDKLSSSTSLSRRDFVRAGATAGVGAAFLATPAVAQEQPSAQDQQLSAQDIEWDYEADLVICGGGACGLSAAIRARDAGLSVIVVDQNFDPCGRMLHSGGLISLGGGDVVQQRDAKGESDREGFITAPPQHQPEDVDDSVDLLFRDVTDWSVLDAGGQPIYRFNDPDVHRAWAEHCPEVREFLIDNYVRMGRITGTQPCNGMSRARRAPGFLMLGDTTDIKAGTITQEDAGIPGQTTSHFAPTTMTDGTALIGPNSVYNGAAVGRPLEFSAREKGVQFILNRHMDELIREQPHEGPVVGIRASYTPRMDAETGEQLTSLWTNGNIDETRDVIHVRANRGILIATGGHASNPQFRAMFNPRMADPTYWSTGYALLGPHGYDGSGIIAGMRVGAGLAGMHHNLASWSDTFVLSSRIATRDPYTAMYPGHPTFGVRGSTGITIFLPTWEHFIVVNQVGRRFYNEMDMFKRVPLGGVWPGGPDAGSPKPSLEYVQGDWRNCHPDWVRQMYIKHSGVDALIQVNEGSQAPDYFAGPAWAIFDQGTIDRAGIDISYPYTSDTNGCFFSADTIEELAEKIQNGADFQNMPLTHLAETVSNWNSYVDNGSDPDFNRGTDAAMHKIESPPFYAAVVAPQWHDSYGGLRVNGRSQVLDTQGQPIPGLYAGGEVAGGSTVHGLGRAITQGYIAMETILADG